MMSNTDLLILSGADVEQVITKFTPHELVKLMAKVFVDLNDASPDEDQKSVNIPHRSIISSPNHNVLFMPARLAPLAGTAIKIVSVPTPNAPQDVRANGLPASTMILDEHTGQVSAVVNARKLTALRNAASESYIFVVNPRNEYEHSNQALSLLLLSSAFDPQNA